MKTIATSFAALLVCLLWARPAIANPVLAMPYGYRGVVDDPALSLLVWAAEGLGIVLAETYAFSRFVKIPVTQKLFVYVLVANIISGLVGWPLRAGANFGVVPLMLVIFALLWMISTLSEWFFIHRALKNLVGAAQMTWSKSLRLCAKINAVSYVLFALYCLPSQGWYDPDSGMPDTLPAEMVIVPLDSLDNSPRNVE